MYYAFKNILYVNNYRGHNQNILSYKYWWEELDLSSLLIRYIAIYNYITSKFISLYFNKVSLTITF